MARGVEELTNHWLASLAHERRVSPHTLRAYGDDVRRFLAFFAVHRGGSVKLPHLQALRPADVRAFLTARRAEGLGPRGVQRALAGLRSFYRYSNARIWPMARRCARSGAPSSRARCPGL